MGLSAGGNALLCNLALAAPGTPGTPQPPVLLYAENFENGTGTAAVMLNNYTGASGETYTADPAWLTDCNGAILEYNTPPSDTAVPGCGAPPSGFGRFPVAHLGSLAYALGVLRNSPSPATNHLLAGYTYSQDPGANSVEFQTVQPIVLPSPGTRLITFSVDSAATSCLDRGTVQPLYQFNFINPVGGTVTPIGGQINPCTDPRTTQVATPYKDPNGVSTTQTNWVGTFYTSTAITFTGTSFDIQLLNAAATPFGGGNDAGIDNIQAYDSTPQLDKSFNPASTPVGATSTLTLTITNTSDLAAKTGLAFVDTLPAGLVIAAPAASTTCGAGTTLTASPGSNVVSVSNGSLASAAAYCTVSVTVTSNTAGTYSNGPSNISNLAGLNLPGSTSVTFVPYADMQATGAATQTVTANAPVTVVTTCSNAGPQVAQDPTCVVTGGGAGVTLTASNTTCSATANPLPVNGVITCTTTFTPTTAGTVNLTTTAGASTADPQPGNNAAPSLVNVGAITANPDSSTTAQNTPVTTAVTTNDTATGAPLNPASVTPTQPSHGTVACNNPTAGSCVYTPATNYSGPDSYTYSVCDTTRPSPVCATTTVSIIVQPNLVTANPDTASTPQNTPVTTSVIGNDMVNPTGAPLNPASVTPTQPAHGSVACDATGKCTYTPNPSYSGPDQYTYQVCDTSTPTPVCSSTTVNVTIGANTVTALPDSGTTPYATPVTTAVVANDTTSAAPLNPSSVTVMTPPAQGTVVCNTPTAGSCVYTPPTGFSGQAIYTYQVCDTSTPTPACASTTVTIQVGPQANNDTNTTTLNTPVNGNVSTNDQYPSGSVFSQATPPSHGTLTFNTDGTYTFVPATNYSGPDTFTYTVCEPVPNQTLCSTATVNLTVSGTSPVANPDTTVTPFNTPVSTRVIGNDTTTGAPLNPASVVPTQPAHGTVACDTSGNCIYTPTSGYSGPDQYTYTVCDQTQPTPACAGTTVSVQVGPNAVNDAVSTAFNTPVGGNASTNDAYPAGSTFVGTAPPSHGTVNVNADGTYTYTPATGFSGTDTFTYTVCEAAPSQTLCSTATVSVTVAPPVAASGSPPVEDLPLNGRWMLGLMALVLGGLGLQQRTRLRRG